MRVISADSFERAEAAFEAGEFENARDAYREVLLVQLASDSGPTWRSAVAHERMADIAYLFGEEEKAEQFLRKIRDDFKQTGRLYEADLISLKLASIATTRGLFYVARETLTGLSARPEAELYELELDVEVEGLDQWESKWQWAETNVDHQSVFFASFYLVVGRIAAGEGHYERAIALLKRGLVHVGGPCCTRCGPSTYSLASRGLPRTRRSPQRLP